MANDPNNDISLKGLDTFSKQFLLGNAGPKEGEAEYISVAKGQQLKPEVVKRYQEERMSDFVKRSCSFTEDLVAFFIEQKKMRSLSDIEAVFGLALATINLRNTYGSAQGGEKPFTEEQAKAMLDEFDAICGGAQDYYDANT